PVATSAPDGVRAASAPVQPSSPAPPSMVLAIGEIVVKDGRLAWRDEAVTPRAALDFAGIDASIAGAGWPLGRPLGIKAAARPLGGGQVQVAGRVGVEPISADLRVTVTDTEIAPYQPYVPVPARIAGRTDLDVAVVLPSWPAEKATVRGRAAVSRLDVRDGERSVVRAERVSASSLDIDWRRRSGQRARHHRPSRRRRRGRPHRRPARRSAVCPRYAAARGPGRGRLHRSGREAGAARPEGARRRDLDPGAAGHDWLVRRPAARRRGW